MRKLLSGAAPAWYDLEMQGLDLFIHVHPKAARLVEEVTARSPLPIAESLREELALPPFQGALQSPWGFGNVLFRARPKRSGWRTWKLTIPPIFTKGGNKVLEPGRAFRFSATLQILFLALNAIEEDTDSPFLQLLSIDHLTTRSGIYGGAMSVRIFPPLCYWLSKHPDGDFLEIRSAMQQAYERMVWERFFFPQEFKVFFNQPKWIHLDIPGNACGLDPDSSWDDSLDMGYELVPHNTDTPIQQLTLLVGIAKLNQLARGL